MKPYEFMRFYHPKLGKFVYKHKGSGIIVDNIFEPMRRILSPVVKKFAKPFGKKALKSGITYTGEKAGRKIALKLGDRIMEKLRNMRKGDARQKALVPPIKQQQQEESTDMFINRLISGSGIKRRSRVKNYVI